MAFSVPRWLSHETLTVHNDQSPVTEDAGCKGDSWQCLQLMGPDFRWPPTILAPFVAMPFVPFVASLFLVRPGAPSSVLLLVVRMASHLIAMFEEGDAKSKDCRRAREGRRKNNRSSKRTMPCLQDQAREALSQLGDSSTRRHAYLRRLPQMFLQFGELSTNLK